MNDHDIRVEICKDLSVRWHARGKMTHLPTGVVVEFEEQWNDRTGRFKAIDELKRRVAALGQQARPE